MFKRVIKRNMDVKSLTIIYGDSIVLRQTLRVDKAY